MLAASCFLQKQLSIGWQLLQLCPSWAQILYFQPSISTKPECLRALHYSTWIPGLPVQVSPPHSDPQQWQGALCLESDPQPWSLLQPGSLQSIPQFHQGFAEAALPLPGRNLQLPPGLSTTQGAPRPARRAVSATGSQSQLPRISSPTSASYSNTCSRV